MSFWSWLDHKIKADAGTASAGTSMFFPTLTSSQAPPANYENIAKTAYQGNVVVNACIDILTINFVEGKLKVYAKKDDRYLPDHRLQILFNHPNKYTTRFEFWRDFLGYRYIGGNAYIEKIRSGARRTVELWNLRPDRIEIKPSPTDYIESYILKLSGKDRKIPFNDIIHSKTFNPINDFYGQPPLLAAFNDIDADNIATEFIRTVLENKGVAPGILIETPGKLTEELRTRLLAMWNNRNSGGNRGKPGFVSTGTKVHSFGYNMNELAIPDLRNNFESRLCMALHVPPGTIYAMVGLKFSTYSNAAEARKALYEDCIEPLYHEIEALLDQYLVPEFGSDIYVKFDTSGITALADQRKAAREEVRENFKSGLLTRNQALIKMGEDPVGGGDIFLQPMNLVSVDATVKTSRKSICGCNTEHKATSGVANLAVLTGRVNAAKAWNNTIRDAVITEFEAEKRDVDALAKKIGKLRKKADGDDIDKALISELSETLPNEYAGWIKRIQENLNPVLSGVLGTATSMVATELGIDFDISSATQQKFVQEYGFKFAKKINDTFAKEIQAQILLGQQGNLTYHELVNNIDDILDKWAGKGVPKGFSFRADMIARTETARATNQGALQVYMAEGIKQVEWKSVGDSCAYCASLDGTIVQTGNNFIDHNADYIPDPQEKVVDGVVVTTQAPPMKATYEAINAPPAHPDCDCVLVEVI